MPSNSAGRGSGGKRDADVERRKAEHVKVVAESDVEHRRSAGCSDVHLVHQALPVADLDDVDLSVEFLGRRLQAPFLISAMTGGHAAATPINAVLARAAARHGLAMGLGSQRAAIRDPALDATYRVAREEAPDAFLIANIGAPQLVRQESGEPLGVEQLQHAVDMIGADALAVHLNFLEETVQPEGDRRAREVPEALARLTSLLGVPVIAKETGAGLSRSTALELRRLGFHALDVGGLGGTSFVAVEAQRARVTEDHVKARLGEVFHDWGIPTAVSVVAARAAGLPLVATGGVRTGLDAAKAIALGATLVGMARPFLIAALDGEAAVEILIAQLFEELRVAVFLSGGRSVRDLGSADVVLLGQTRRWLDDLGYLEPSSGG